MNVLDRSIHSIYRIWFLVHTALVWCWRCEWSGADILGPCQLYALVSFIPESIQFFSISSLRRSRIFMSTTESTAYTIAHAHSFQWGYTGAHRHWQTSSSSPSHRMLLLLMDVIFDDDDIARAHRYTLKHTHTHRHYKNEKRWRRIASVPSSETSIPVLFMHHRTHFTRK